MSLMTPRALRTLRRNAKKWMVDEIAIYESGSFEDTDDDLEVEHTQGDLFWQGMARIRPTSGPSEQAIGETIYAMRDADINIPYSAPAPRADMRVKVITSADPALETRWFRITDVRVFGQQATRKFSVIQSQPEKDWSPSE